MPVRLRRILLSLPVLIIGGLFLVYLLLGWFAFDPFARWLLPKTVAERSGYVLQLKEARFHPLRLSVDLAGVSLADPKGKTLLTLDRAYVDLDSWGLFSRTIALDEVRLEHPVAAVEVMKGGRVNWMDFIEAIEARQKPEPQPAADASPARVAVRRFVLQGGRVDFSDTTVEGGFKTQLDALDISLDQLSTLPEAQGSPYELKAHLTTGAQLHWKGRFDLNPITASGELSLDKVSFASIWPYVQRSVGMAAPDGTVSLALRYDAAYANKRFGLKLSSVTAHAEKFRFVDSGFVVPMVSELADLKLSFSADAGFGGGPSAFDVQGLKLGASDLKVRSGNEAAPWLQLVRVDLEGGFVKLAKHEAGASKFTVAGGAVGVERDAQGRISLQKTFERKSTGPTPPREASKETAKEPGWKYAIGKVDLGGVSVSLADRAVSPAVALDLDVQASAQGLGSDVQAAVPVQLAVNVKSGGRLEAKGSVVPANGALDLQLLLKDLVVAPAQPYLSPLADLSLVGGRIDTEGRVRYGKDVARYDGKLAVRDLSLLDRQTRENFVSWKSLSTPRLSVTSTKLDVGPLDLAGLDARLIIFKDRSLNLAKAFKPGGAASAASAASSSASAPAPIAPAADNDKPPAYAVEVERVRIADSRLDFSDLSLALPFRARIHDLRGRLTDVSNLPDRSSRIDLTGRVDEYGVAKASGRLDLLKPTSATDVKVVFENIEMTSLTPYSATFAGRRIASGKLSLDLDYKLENRQIKGENKVVMDKLTLGERVDSAQAMDLPLDLALAILRDRDGRINLGLPVSGSLDDPQFSYSAVVWKAFRELIVRAVTSPFRAIGALVGGDGDEESPTPTIVFEAGSSELPPPQREKLDQMAAALAQRPAIGLTVTGNYDPTLDGEALRRRQVRRAIAAEMGRNAPAAVDPAASSPDRPDRRRALESLYEKAFGPEAVRALTSKAQQGNTVENSEMMRRLVERETLADDDFVKLGNARADAVQRQLGSKGLGPDRVKLGPPARLDAQGTRATLAVAAEATTAAAKSDQ